MRIILFISLYVRDHISNIIDLYFLLVWIDLPQRSFAICSRAPTEVGVQ